MKQDKIQKAYDKMLEGVDVKKVFQNMDSTHANEIRNRYYAISDNIDTLVETIALIPELKQDYQNAKMVKKYFDKISLGKYI